jgi:hypothetical protein
MQSVTQAWTASRARSELERGITSSQGPDGGWPYYPRRISRVEPTCWALLAIAALHGLAHPAIARARTFLHGLQQKDGLLVEPGMSTSNHAWSGLALLADMSIEEASVTPFRRALIDGLVAVKGIALEDGNSPVRQNNRLQAWSWTPETFSWIEPTATCVLALKKSGASSALVRTRLTEAEAMILDRVCEGGGWNYGNAQVLGQDLRPYVPTTALTLLAMQDRRNHPAIGTSLAWLRTHAASEPATMALALAGIALHVCGGLDDATHHAVIQRASNTIAFGNLHLMAMGLYALTVAEHGAAAFNIG